MTHLSLFSGIGGLDIAAEWAGFDTVGQCEWADYPTKVLEKHWPNVPRWRDICGLSADGFRIKTGLDRPTIISGGFPCQPFSVAGNQKGEEDDRYLWPEMLRVITELTPRWIVGENVPGILRIAGRTVCEDLEHAGYSVTVFDFEAAAVGAPHRRERVFFVGHRADIVADTGHGRLNAAGLPSQLKGGADAERAGEDVADTSCPGLQRAEQRSHYDNKACRGQESATRATTERCRDGGRYWSAEPDVGRVAHGVPARVDRIKCLGNAVVPQQAYPIFKAIAEIERGVGQ